MERKQKLLWNFHPLDYCSDNLYFCQNNCLDPTKVSSAMPTILAQPFTPGPRLMRIHLEQNSTKVCSEIDVIPTRESSHIGRFYFLSNRIGLAAVVERILY